MIPLTLAQVKGMSEMSQSIHTRRVAERLLRVWEWLEENGEHGATCSPLECRCGLLEVLPDKEAPS